MVVPPSKWERRAWHRAAVPPRVRAGLLRGARSLRPAVASGAVVVDDLDVVPVGVEHERAVVARVIDGALAGRAVVLVACGERGGVERAHRGVLARGEREV